MKRLIFISLVFSITLYACVQVPPFEKVVQFNAGFKFGPTGQVYLSLPAVGTLDWAGIIGKPVFSTVALTGDYNDLKNLPQQISLTNAIENLGYLPVPERTTTEINATMLPAGKSGIVKDKTLKCYKLWNSDTMAWDKIVITNN